MHSEIEELEQRLAALRQAAGSARTGRGSGAAQLNRAASSSAHRQRRQVTPELAQSRRLQGEYMGLLRHLEGRARARMKKLASDQGREAAIRAMRASLSK
jgi:hypothetical protein